MKEKDYIIETDDFLKRKHKEMMLTLNEVAATFPLYSPPLFKWEAKYFMIGLESNLFKVDNSGYVQSPMLSPTSSKSKQQKTIQLFWKQKNGKYKLFREGVCQMATASYLAIHHKYTAENIEMEPGRINYNELAYAVDMLVKKDDGRVVICCEVKRNEEELNALIKGFTYCCNKGLHEKEECKFKSNHPKYVICEKLRPLLFLAISPEKKLCYELEYSDGRIGMTKIEALDQSLKSRF